MKSTVNMTIKVTVANSVEQNVHEFLDKSAVDKKEIVQRLNRAYSYAKLFDVHPPDQHMGGDWWVDFSLVDPDAGKIDSTIQAARDYILSVIEDAKKCALRTTLKVL